MDRERLIEREDTTQRVIEVFEKTAGYPGITFDEYGINEERLRENTFGNIAEKDREQVATEVIKHFLTFEDEEAGSAPWYFPEGREVTDQMQRDRGTMRALLVANLQTPDKKMKNRLARRTVSLFQDEVYALPYLGRMDKFLPPGSAGRVLERLGDKLGTDYELDEQFLDRFGDYAEAKWAKDFAFRTATNTGIAKRITDRLGGQDKFFWVKDQPWYSELQWFAQSVLNAEKIFTRHPAALVADFNAAVEDGKVIVDPRVGTTNMHFPVGYGSYFKQGSSSWLKEIDHTRYGEAHDILGFRYSVGWGCGAD